MLRALVEAAAPDGFTPQPGTAALTLIGDIVLPSGRYTVRIAFATAELVEPPRFWLTDTGALPRPVTPHIDEEGEICVVDRTRFVFDRYRAPAQLRGLIVRAREILADAGKSTATAEIAAEFPRYWALHYRNVVEGDENTAFLRTDQALSFRATEARPQTLGDLLDWAGAWDRSLETAMHRALAGLSAADPTLVIDAPNGTILAQLMVSARGQAFLNALARPEGWQRFLSTKEVRKLAIRRLTGRRAGMATILAMNGSPLAGRCIAVIGCGAIGGYLVRMLVQLGAGFGNGRLIMLDDDMLEPANIRRHALGMGRADEAKVEACAELLRRDFPGVSILARRARAEAQLMLVEMADLIVDVTGEQAVSEWLNDWALARRRAGEAVPTVLHGWVSGHGAAAQSFISTDADFACYRCLQPDHREPARFDPLRDPPEEPVVECGASASLPYGPQAPVQAAALVAAHAADWAAGKGRPLLRTVRVDWSATVKRDPVNPLPSPICPACAAG